MSDLFRQSALDKLSSPEQLDKDVVITPPAFWIALTGGVLIVLGAVIWGIFGRLPISVDANGIYVSGDGTGGIYSEVEGMVTQIDVREGETVKEGDVVAYIGGGDITSEIKNLGERIKSVESVTLNSTSDTVTSDNKAIIDVKSELLTMTSTYEQSKKALDDKKAQMKEEESKMNQLLAKANALESSYYGSLGNTEDASAQVNYTEAQTELSQAQQLYESAYSSLQSAQLELSGAQTDYNMAESDYSKASSSFDQAEAVRADCQNAYSQKLQEVSAATDAEEKASLQEEADQLGKQLSEAEAAKSSAQTALAGAQSNLEKADANVSNAQDAYDAASQNLTNYEAQLSSAQEYYDSAKAAYVAAANSSSRSEQNQTIAGNDYSNAMTLYNTQASIYESVKQEVNSLETQTSQAKDQMELKKKEIEVSFQSAKDSVISSLKLELNKYTENLKKYEVLATRSGNVQEIVATEGTIVSAGTEIVKIKQGEEAKKEAVCYISMSTGKKVVPGMKVMIYPTTVNKQEYGHMVGTVESVASYVTSTSEIQKRLGDDTLVQSFLNNGPVIEVVCSLTEDSDTASGYYWSSKKGADVMLAEGTMLTASIVTEKKAPITMLIPYLKEKLTMDNNSATTTEQKTAAQ